MASIDHLVTMLVYSRSERGFNSDDVNVHTRQTPDHLAGHITRSARKRSRSGASDPAVRTVTTMQLPPMRRVKRVPRPTKSSEDESHETATTTSSGDANHLPPPDHRIGDQSQADLAERREVFGAGRSWPTHSRPCPWLDFSVAHTPAQRFAGSVDEVN